MELLVASETTFNHEDSEMRMFKWEIYYGLGYGAGDSFQLKL